MSFPEVTYTRDSDASAALISNAAEAGLQLGPKLSVTGQLQSVVANLLVSDPSTITIPAGDISSGTLGSGVPDTGTYRFPSLFGSVTALATPGALIATAFNAFASTVSAAQGSLYLKSNGSGIGDRLWVNTNGTTGWTNFVSAA